MANPIYVTVENPDELLNAGMYGAGAIIRLQSSEDNVTFANEATAPLVAATRFYTLYDVSGTSITWYRTRYENVGGTVLSDWSAAFQVGDETGGLLCSLYNVKQRLTGTATANDDELLLGFIRAQSAEVLTYTRRQFTPTSTTYRFDALIGENLSGDCRTLWVDRGLRSITTLKVASSEQPDTAGTYTTVTTGYTLRPSEMDREYGWPATRLVLLDTAGVTFTHGINTVEITGTFGFAAVPLDVSQVVENAVIRRFIAKGSGVATAVGTEDFGTRILRWVAPEERTVLDHYRVRWAG